MRLSFSDVTTLFEVQPSTPHSKSREVSAVSQTIEAITATDVNISRVMFQHVQRSKLLSTLAGLVTLSGDESVCFPVSAVLGTLMLWTARDEAASLAARRVLRLFGDFGALCLLEGALKLCVS